MTQITRIGLLGVGKISGAYFHGISMFPGLKITACADQDAARARTVAAEHGIRAAESVEALLHDHDVDLIVNLTIPAAHAELNIQALEAGKHVYVEKPLAVHVAEGAASVQAAARSRKIFGCAPDTFLGSGQQTVRSALDAGKIGTPFAATAFMTCRGHETWHPSPEFYYQPGGGPMMDMGPYYLTALVNLFGPIRRIAGVGCKAFQERTITSQPLHGKVMEVGVNTHITGIAEFENGVITTLIMSFDTPHTGLPLLQIYGTEGTLCAPDPNTFDNPVIFWAVGAKEPETLVVRHAIGMGRGSGPADMVAAAATGRKSRVDATMALHVLEAMAAFERSGVSGEFVTLETRATRPEAIPAGLPLGNLY